VPRPRRRHSVATLLALLAGALATACAGGDDLAGPDRCLEGEPPRLSLLAVGDTGDRPEWLAGLDQYREVGRALAAEHRRRPADALLLLGDNFYSEGLEPDEAVARIRDNVVVPFCSFVALDGPRSAELEEACEVPRAERRPIPIHVVLGNHDHNTPESPRLQRELVPRFVSNWRMPPDLVGRVELPGGVSLLVVDSEQLERGADAGPLAEALAASRGPWRIVMGHHPVGAGDVGFKRGLLDALAQSQVRPQLLLAGHEHNLAVAEAGPPLPPLSVISGAGSRVREPRYGVVGLDYVAVRPGFARIDLVGEGESERLVVSLVATPKHDLDFWSGTELLGCWSVDRSGTVRGEPTAAGRASRHALAGAG